MDFPLSSLLKKILLNREMSYNLGIPLRIDLLTEIDGVTFEECFKNRKEVVIEDLKVNFIG